ncbi:MAG: bifunctional 3,4-dihydroxy-2-butanone-4-phosphate synthase/GTP cyclohydrolase II [bacterium]
MKLNTIKEGIKDIKAGKMIIVVDDEKRENEGDFLAAAKKVTSEMINFMAKYGRGLICAPITKDKCDELGLDLMVDKNNALYETPFTISIDLKGRGCTTGISAHDRAKTIKALTNSKTRPQDFGKPGHIFPLRAKAGGVLRRAGHTEAAVDLARLAGLPPAGVIVEILNDDGTMARLPQLFEIAKKFDLKIVSIEDLIKYRLKNDAQTTFEKVSDTQGGVGHLRATPSVNLPTEFGNFILTAYKQKQTNEIHLALIKGKWKKNEPILVRVHSSCVTGDIFYSKRCDCGKQLKRAMQMVEKEGKGVILYMQQEGRGIGVLDKLRAYKLQEKGLDTVEANLELGYKDDERDYGVGAQILRDLKISKIKLISNNPNKKIGLQGYGLEIIKNIPIKIKANKYNKKYLKTKREKMGHAI